jgi:phenylalanyl-tRNA synthetase alpha subunit
MRDSIFNVKSSGLGSISKDIGRTAKLIKKSRKDKQAKKEKEQKQLIKEQKQLDKKNLSLLNKEQRKLTKEYHKQLAGSKKQPRTTSFKINRPYTQSVKGTIHPVMKGYKVPKYNTWGDRIG